MDLGNGTSISHKKVTPLLDVGKTLLFYTAQYQDFVITVNYVAKHHIGMKYIHDGYQIILMKSDKTLIYSPFQETPFH